MFIKILRRTHMYLGLFLIPWTLVYALSTLSMNHFEFLKKAFGYTNLQYEEVKELPYPGVFSEDTTPNLAALQILSDLDFEGAHYVQGNFKSEYMTIVRRDPVTPKRIKYFPAEKKIIIEQAEFQIPTFLSNLHTRHGYQYDYPKDDAWAASVDLFVFAMIFWVLSGLWLWWKMRKTHRLGIVFALGGIAVFCLFLFTI